MPSTGPATPRPASSRPYELAKGDPDSWGIVNKMIVDEDAERLAAQLATLHAALDALPADVREAAVKHYGHGAPWSQLGGQAMRKRVERRLPALRAAVSRSAGERTLVNGLEDAAIVGGPIFGRGGEATFESAGASASRQLSRSTDRPPSLGRAMLFNRAASAARRNFGDCG